MHPDATDGQTLKCWSSHFQRRALIFFFFFSFFMLLFFQAGLVDWIATSFQSRHIKECWLFFFIFSPPPLLLSIPIICSKHLPISIRWEEAYSLIAHPIWFLPSSSSLLCSLKSLFYFIFFLSSSSSFFPKNFYKYSIPLSLFFFSSLLPGGTTCEHF